MLDIIWSHGALGAAAGKGASQKCPLLPTPQPQSLSCHQTRYVPITWLDLETCPVMGLIDWVRVMLALRRKMKVGRKDRRKAVQTFDNKVLSGTEISSENGIPHFLLLQVVPTKRLGH